MKNEHEPATASDAAATNPPKISETFAAAISVLDEKIALAERRYKSTFFDLEGARLDFEMLQVERESVQLNVDLIEGRAIPRVVVVGLLEGLVEGLERLSDTLSPRAASDEHGIEPAKAKKGGQQ